MSLPALIGFAGVLAAAVATGLLAGRAVRQPRLGTILWTAATLALTVALAAQSMGFASGFGSATFRAVQLFALLLAPLWLAWGLVEVVWPGDAARFGVRLAAGALTVVGSVILATDPLTAAPFGKAWPLAGPHYQPPSHYALDVAQAVAVILAAASIGLAAAQARSDGSWPGALPGTAAVGLAVFMTVGLRFSLPARSAYPLLSLLAAALVWFGATRSEARPRRGSRAAGRTRTVPGEAARGRTVPGKAARGKAARGKAAREKAIHDEAVHDKTGGGEVDRERTARERGGQDPGAYADGRGRRIPGEAGRWAEGPRRPPAAPRPDWPPGGFQGPGPGGLGPDARLPVPPETGFAAPARPEIPAAPPYGRILIFTLLDDRVADFDLLAEQAAEEVRTREPDTLVYVIHLVPNAPMQRIFYEIYRDRAAFDRHENQPYMKRFVADRRACVLATNVIELRLKYAKVAPLPSPQLPSPAHPRAQLPPGQPRPGPPPGVTGPPRPQSLEPLPPRAGRRQPPAERRHGGI
jgi:quinol monooxygenase YgiN